MFRWIRGGPFQRPAASEPPEASWPFADPPNVAVFTSRHVLRSGKPILRVSHDADDGAWQFHHGGPIQSADAMIVALQEMLAHDGSLADLANLPQGWCAERVAAGKPWTRRPLPGV